MLSTVRIAGFLWSFLAVAAAAGCAGRRDASSAVSMHSGADMASLEGTWVGQVWEMPVHYTLQIGRDGSWTAAAGGSQCASGTASVNGGLVVLGGTRVGQEYCMPYSLATNDERMKGVFETSFKGRPGSAMIGLDRRSATAQTTAR